jgi:hypothetical protein
MDSKEKIFVGSIEDVMNSQILGDEFNRTFWRCPIEKEQTSTTKKVGIVSLSNGRSRKVIEDIDDLIDLCIVDPNKNQKWKTAWEHYRKAFVILRKKGEDYTTKEIEDFQNHIDIFFQLYVGGLVPTRGSHELYPYARQWACEKIYGRMGEPQQIFTAGMGIFECIDQSLLFSSHE